MKRFMNLGCAVGLLALCAASACGKTEPTEAPAATEATQPAPVAAPVAEPAPAVAASAEPTPEEVPVPEDFQAEARTEITASNLKAELDTIEKELGKPAP